MYKNFIFDMGNVLVDFSPDYIISRFTSNVEEIELIKKVIFGGNDWAKLDQGVISFEEVCELSKKELPENLHSIIDKFFTEWHLHKSENLEMTNLVIDLKLKGYGIYLCSNAAARFHSYKDKYEFYKYFDDITISADIKISKPDKRIYEQILNKHRLEPKSCLFIDDLKENINGAENVGMAGYHFNGNTDLLKEYLITIGIL